MNNARVLYRFNYIRLIVFIYLFIMLLYDTIRCNDYCIALSCFYLIQYSVVAIIRIIRLYMCLSVTVCLCLCVCVFARVGVRTVVCVCGDVCACGCCTVLLIIKSYYDST